MLELDFINLVIENANSTGIALLLASLAVCVTFVVLTIKMLKTRQVSIPRAIGRIIWNSIWIPLDVYVLFMIFFS